MRVINKICCLFLLSLLCACSTSTVKINLLASKHINPDENRHALPVLIRVYTLSSNDEFMDATFRELWHSDKTVLANTLIHREEYSLNPNSKLILKISHPNNAKYLAVVALFRHPEGSHWRVIQEMPSRFSESVSDITIIVHGDTLKLK